MEIDIFPIPSSEGVHRYIGTAFLGLIIITYIVGAFMLAQKLIGEDKELLCLLATIPIFIGGYASSYCCSTVSNNVSMPTSNSTEKS